MRAVAALVVIAHHTGELAEKAAVAAEVLVTVLVRQLIMVVVVVVQAHQIQAATAIKAL
jgi:hypothetical protein